MLQGLARQREGGERPRGRVGSFCLIGGGQCGANECQTPVTAWLKVSAGIVAGSMCDIDAGLRCGGDQRT